MHKIIGRWIPNPDYVGNNIQFVVPPIDEQIENEKFFYARQMYNLTEDYHRRMKELQETHARKMADFLEKKDAEESKQDK